VIPLASKEYLFRKNQRRVLTVVVRSRSRNLSAEVPLRHGPHRSVRKALSSTGACNPMFHSEFWPVCENPNRICVPEYPYRFCRSAAGKRPTLRNVLGCCRKNATPRISIGVGSDGAIAGTQLARRKSRPLKVAVVPKRIVKLPLADFDSTGRGWQIA
jgi:hypothetical protein